MRERLQAPPSVQVGAVVLGALAVLAGGSLLAGPAPNPELPAGLQVRQVKDLLSEEIPGDLPYPYDSFVNFVQIADVVVFRAWDGVHGWELWRTDGTAGGTGLLVDLCPGECSSFPFELRSMLGSVYFHATTADLGNTIWRTDGTAGGTELVVDVPAAEGRRTTSTVVSPFFAEYLSSIFFVANDGVSGGELWRSDGQPGGTTELIADLRPGTESSWPASLFVVGDSLFFTADDGTSGRELWKTDGTTAGTVMVEDLCPGPEDCLWWETLSPPSGPRIFARADEKLILVAGEGGFDWRLWVSDGTADGTQALGGLKIGEIFPFPASDGSVLLSAQASYEGDELWRTDGTPGGTFLVKEIHPSPTIGSDPSAWGTTGGVVYMSAYDGTHGSELWRTDGTANGTYLVADVLPGEESGLNGSFFPLVPLPTTDVVYFPADDGQHGREFWVSDGSAGGTTLLVDANPGPASGYDWIYRSFPGEIDDRLIFFAYDANYRSRLWISDGSPAGTDLLQQIHHQTSSMQRLSLPVLEPSIAAASGALLFRANDGDSGIELFGSDGTSSGTGLVKDLCAPPCLDDASRGPRELTTVDKKVFLVAPEGDDWQLWVSDGSADGTMRVDPDLPASFYEQLEPWKTVGRPGRMLFTGTEGLFVTDGTSQGTHALNSGYPVFPTPAQDRVFFACGSPVRELCLSFGDPDDGQWVPGTNDIEPERITALGKRVVFSADDGVTGREMWISDGTESGTRLIQDINPGPQSSVIQDRWGDMTLAAAGGVFFPADDGATGEELWQTDGTPQGTTRIADLTPGSRSSEPRPWAFADPILYFTAWTPETGREIWKLDTRSGTIRLVIDLDPGPGSGITERLVDYWAIQPRQRPMFWNGRLYFAGSDGVHGVELWSTDGTKWGTRLERDINPGPGASSPNGFTSWQDKLFFSATDGVTGWELWVIDAAGAGPTIFADGFESGDTSAWSTSKPTP